MAIFRDPCTFEEAVVLNGSVTFADTPTEIVLTNLTALAIGADGAGTAAPALTLKKTAAGTADVAFKAADDLRGLGQQLHDRQGRQALATPALADDGHGFTFVQRIRDTVDRVNHATFGVEPCDEVAYF